ncbi:MAG: HRDC-like protein [Monoraphidium minutum]|nr:MAG: HRDC-like protein [Monoraphidium minutum]
MKILEKNAGLLTNSEVIEALKARGADSDAPSARARPSERMVLRYLEAHSAGALTREQLDAFKQALQPFGLSRTELLQVLNLAPASEVEVHLIIDNAEGRLGEERIAALLEVIAAHAPAAAAKRAGGGQADT